MSLPKLLGRSPRREPCGGSVHTIPVPPGYTPDEAWEEARVFGRLRPYTGTPTWAVVECPGGEACDCRGPYLSRTFRSYHDGRLVAARPLGLLLHLLGWRRP